MLNTPAIADEHATWMCLFTSVPVVVIADEGMLKDKKIAVEITNSLEFAVNKVAVDFNISADGAETLEQNIVFPFPSPLLPGESRELIAYLTMLEDQATALATGTGLTARAAVANVLDIQDRRMVIRENMGPSFGAFWPFQPKSSEVCE